jgi:type IV pilus assembly protein PilW
MNTRDSGKSSNEQGVGLIEVMVGIVIGMLLVLMIFQIYLVTESQKRTITSANDAQENASYGLFLLGQDLAGAGNVISVTTPPAKTPALSGCAMLRPIPVVIAAGATDNDPDSLTVFFGGSGSLSTPAAFLNNALVSTSPPGVYQVLGPVGFSPKDVIAAVQGTSCTLSTINAGGVAVAAGTGIATIAHTLTATPGNNSVATYNAASASLINLGQGDRFGQTLYSVDPTNSALRTQSLLPAVLPATPVVSNVVNLKAQFGLDTDGDGDVDTWQSATVNWSSANLPLQPIALDLTYPWQKIRAVRVAIVTRSEKYETDTVTPGPLAMLCSPAPCAVSMTLTTDQQHYRYKVLETIVPLRNAVWNAP